MTERERDNNDREPLRDLWHPDHQESEQGSNELALSSASNSVWTPATGSNAMTSGHETHPSVAPWGNRQQDRYAPLGTNLPSWGARVGSPGSTGSNRRPIASFAAPSQGRLGPDISTASGVAPSTDQMPTFASPADLLQRLQQANLDLSAAPSEREVLSALYERGNVNLLRRPDAENCDALCPPWDWNWQGVGLNWTTFCDELDQANIPIASSRVLAALRRSTRTETTTFRNILMDEGVDLVRSFNTVRTQWGSPLHRGDQANERLNDETMWTSPRLRDDPKLNMLLQWTRASMALWVSYISAMEVRTANFLNSRPDLRDEQANTARRFLRTSRAIPFTLLSRTSKCTYNHNGVQTHPCEQRYVCTVSAEVHLTGPDNAMTFILMPCEHCQANGNAGRCSKSVQPLSSGSVGPLRIGSSAQ